MVALKDRVGRLQIELTQTTQAKEELAADLETSRAMVQRLQSSTTPSSDMAAHTEAAEASSPTMAATDWYEN